MKSLPEIVINIRVLTRVQGQIRSIAKYFYISYYP